LLLAGLSSPMTGFWVVVAVVILILNGYVSIRRRRKPPKEPELLSPAELAAVKGIFYADHDTNCWFVGVEFEDEANRRNFAVESEGEAARFAQEISAKIMAACGRRVAVRPPET